MRNLTPAPSDGHQARMDKPTSLPASARRLFDQDQGQYSVNALKIRRVLQLASDLARKPLSDMRVLDLACATGAYAIEAALHGAKAMAIDARTERMNEGIEVAAEMGLNVDFRQGDIRAISVKEHGRFDAIFMLGILYHLEAADVLSVLRAASAMTDTVIIDTHVSLRGNERITLDGWTYHGHYFREHHPGESEAERRRKVRASIDNDRSFWFTRKSLTDALVRAGFTSVMEAHAPVDLTKTRDRVTIAARKGEPVRSVGFPWLNYMDQAELERMFPAPPQRPKARKSLPQRIAGKIRRLRPWR